jgi:hypothetical protein
MLREADVPALKVFSLTLFIGVLGLEFGDGDGLAVRDLGNPCLQLDEVEVVGGHLPFLGVSLSLKNGDNHTVRKVSELAAVDPEDRLKLVL